MAEGRAAHLRWVPVARGGLLAILLALTLGTFASSNPRAVAASSCHPWRERTVASGLGVLENLSFDRRGGLLLSAWSLNAILRIGPNRAVRPVVVGVKAPGGQRVRGHFLYFNTGDSPESGLLGIPDGTIERYDLDSGKRVTWASGLTMPNGLVFLRDGSALVSRDLGSGTGITRIPAERRDRHQTNWIKTDDSNGMVIEPNGWLYFVQTFKEGLPLLRVRTSDPTRVVRVGSLGSGTGLDDMTVDPRTGALYVAVNRAPPNGEVIRYDPRTGRSCVIVGGLGFPSSVRFGAGPGWPSDRLYTVGFDGTIHELLPPRP